MCIGFQESCCSLLTAVSPQVLEVRRVDLTAHKRLEDNTEYVTQEGEVRRNTFVLHRLNVALTNITATSHSVKCVRVSMHGGSEKVSS